MKLYFPSLIISIIFTFIGAIFKIQHYPGASLLLLGAILIALIYVFLGIRNVWSKTDKNLVEKIMWTIGFLLFSWITGLAYYITEVKK